MLGVDLSQQEYSGRYLLAKKVEDHLDHVDQVLMQRAAMCSIDVFAVSALDLITDPREARQFAGTVYPLEIAKKIWPNMDYFNLENFGLDRPYHQENNGGLLMNITPRITATRELHGAYDFIFTVVFEEKHRKVRDLRRLWKFER